MKLYYMGVPQCTETHTRADTPLIKRKTYNNMPINLSISFHAKLKIKFKEKYFIFTMSTGLYYQQPSDSCNHK
jgi:hypothetical protein